MEKPSGEERTAKGPDENEQSNTKSSKGYGNQYGRCQVHSVSNPINR